MKTDHSDSKAGKKPRRPRKVVQQYPAGWDEEKVRRVLTHYENQTEEEAAAEDEAAYQAAGQTMMSVPTELVSAVRALIQRHQKTA